MAAHVFQIPEQSMDDLLEIISGATQEEISDIAEDHMVAYLQFPSLHY
jgi:hypothetical protein